MSDRFEIRTFIGDAPVIVHCGEVTLRTLLPLWQKDEPEHTVAIDLQTQGRVTSIVHDEIVEEFDGPIVSESHLLDTMVDIFKGAGPSAGSFENACRAKAAPAHDGKPAWHGQWLQDEDTWATVCNRAGNPIRYASPDAAIAGAVLSHPTLSKLPPIEILQRGEK
jgi:hypothetical protein